MDNRRRTPVLYDDYIFALGLFEVLRELVFDFIQRNDFESWYKGSVITILDLRPRSQIADDAIPTLLRKVKQPTFITINYTDFWKVVAASHDYCVICLKLSGARSLEVPLLTRDVLKMKEFSTKKSRMGKMISWSYGRVSYYT